MKTEDKGNRAYPPDDKKIKKIIIKKETFKLSAIYSMQMIAILYTCYFHCRLSPPPYLTRYKQQTCYVLERRD